MATWQDPALDEQYIAWARDTTAAIEPWSVSGGYVNYMQADEPIERVRAAFGDEAFGRLQTLKGRYDPDNVLRRNQNIPPGYAGPGQPGFPLGGQVSCLVGSMCGVSISPSAVRLVRDHSHRRRKP